MKKLFVSCPVKYRKKEDVEKTISKMHKIAEIQFDQKLEVITPSFDTEQRDIDYLVNAVTGLASADYFIGLNYLDRTIWKNLGIEVEIAREYDIPVAFIEAESVARDAIEIEDTFHGCDRRIRRY